MSRQPELPPRRPGDRRPDKRLSVTQEPSSRQITVEVVVFALLCLLVGAAIVAVQVSRKGDQLLDFDPHGRAKRLSEGR